MRFKDKFIQKYSQLTDFVAYQQSVAQFLRRSIRVNTLKISIKALLQQLTRQDWTFESIPWCKEGFYMSGERRDIGNLLEHQEGLFFVQSSVSLLPVVVLDPQPGQRVLELCAAPGGKTTQMAAMMQNKGQIIAIDSNSFRATILRKNLQRCGVTNVDVLCIAAERYLGNPFDKILLDPPCSASGTIKGETKQTKKTLLEWNPRTIKRLAKLQKKLIKHAFSLLKPGGTLVYSTCSLEPEENEEVVQYLLDKVGGKLETIDLPIKADQTTGLRIWPQYQDTEGFFVAKIRK
ncbi:RsmB/NOP family class I SAM-dependent RNA methyltransferase [Candidatus Woesearchaeota archaeon]|nr:RsmB/NOP family class I SAM-dependent RNA methyltransferase [Candidatus Woesearchaeota archaeon]